MTQVSFKPSSPVDAKLFGYFIKGTPFYCTYDEDRECFDFPEQYETASTLEQELEAFCAENDIDGTFTINE